jgi:hypothetical protein
MLRSAPLAPKPTPRCRQLAGPLNCGWPATCIAIVPALPKEHGPPPGPEAKCGTPWLRAGQRVQAPKTGGVLVARRRQLGQPSQHAAVGAGGGDLRARWQQVAWAREASWTTQHCLWPRHCFRTVVPSETLTSGRPCRTLLPWRGVCDISAPPRPLLGLWLLLRRGAAS